MARSTYVYVVTHLNAPRATFTVKHELETWLSRQGRIRFGFRVFRFPDGVHWPTDTTTPTEITSEIKALNED